MRTLLKGGNVYDGKSFEIKDILYSEEGIISVGESVNLDDFDRAISCMGMVVATGLCDVHVHFREPGFEYKETVETGSRAAAAGGYTNVCTMPNLNPAPVNFKTLSVQLSAIKKSALIDVVPMGRITDSGMLANMYETADLVAGFSDDGAGVMDTDLMKKAMKTAKILGKIIVAHAEDTSYEPIDPRSEYMQLDRDLNLVAETGCSYHICHISSKESVALVREAKKAGLDVTCETAPHYLVFTDKNIPDEGRFKMNPPIRSAQDRSSLIEGIEDGTIDMIATDHAPHSAEEKAKGFSGSLNGIVGLECAFPVMYTNLVESTIITPGRLFDLMAINPKRRFGIGSYEIKEGCSADFVIIDPDIYFMIDSSKFKSKGRSTPFDGMHVKGRVEKTIYKGSVVYGRD